MGERVGPVAWAATEPTYPQVGATRAALLEGAPLPEGYHHVRHAGVIGHGVAAYDAAAALVRSWGMHRAAGLRVEATGPAVQGTTSVATVGVGALSLVAPCRVVWSVAEPGPSPRTGFGYGTLPGHPVRGEEGFLVVMHDGGEVVFGVAAFSVPARWYVRLAGPVARAGQALFARRCAGVLAKAADLR